MPMHNTLTLDDGTLIKISDADLLMIIRALEMAALDADKAADATPVTPVSILRVRESLRKSATDYRNLAVILQGGE